MEKKDLMELVAVGVATPEFSEFLTKHFDEIIKLPVFGEMIAQMFGLKTK